MKKLILISLLFSYICTGLAQEGYPKPTVKDVLFYIQHSRGKNTFIYQANYSAPNHLHEKEPIKTSRQLFDKNGEIKPLTSIQRRYAYGIKTKKIDSNYYEVELVSYPDQKLFLKLDKHNQPFVEGTINGHYMKIDRLFIKLKDGTSGLQVQAAYILFYGVDKHGNSVQFKLFP